jgi:hypothetical protein
MKELDAKTRQAVERAEHSDPTAMSTFPVAIEDWNHPERHANPLLLRNIDREGIRL